MHIMLDLETWGKFPGCDIRSIGAVVFDPVAGIVGRKSEANKTRFYVATENPLYVATENPLYVATENPFYVATENPPVRGHWSARKYPLIRDPAPGQWWEDQTAEAQAAFANPVDLKEACHLFGLWYYTLDPTDPPRIWANGPQFDVSILEAVFQIVGLTVPWHYRAPRDFRTITEAAGMIREDFCNYGTARNALDNAIAQAMTVCEAYKRLGLQNAAKI